MSALFSRGSSVLAALVLVGALAVATLAVQALSGPQNPQALKAEAGGATGATPALAKSKGVSAACDSAKKSAAAAGKSQGAETLKKTSKDSNLIDECVAAVLKSPTADPKKETSYKCVGKTALISISGKEISKAVISDQSVPNPNQPEGRCEVKACAPADADGKLNCFNTTMGTITFKSLTASFSGATEGINLFTAEKSSMDKLFDAGTGQPIAFESQSALEKAFQEQQNIAQTEIQNNDKTISELQKQIDAGSSSPEELAKLQEQKNALEAKNAELKNQMNNLSNSQVQDLAPGAGNDICTVGGMQVGCDKGSKELYVTAEEKDTVEKNGYSCMQDPSGGSDYAYACIQRPTAGEVVPYDYNCVKSIDPVNVVKVPAGSPMPSGCYNDRNAPPLPPNNTFNRSSGAEQRQTPDRPGGGGGLDGLMKAILGGLAQGLARGLAQQPGQACPSDPNAYAQQQQQYNQQMQQYNYQLQQYNYQQQLSYMNGMPAPIPPIAPQPCTPNSHSNTCPAAPAQPSPAGCPNGTWRPITTQQGNGYQCTSGWQCVPGGGTVPKAEISCSPKVADVGMTVTIAYGCSNATGSTGQGFDTQNQLSGSTTTVITAPPAGATGANFELNCTNGGASARAQCTVQIGRPTIVLVANPKVVDPGKASTIGWITTGMQSCVVSSPEDGAFTAENATNTSVNGMASTSPLTSPIHVLLHCVTIGGGTRDATTTVSVVGQPDIDDTDPDSGTVTVQSTADGASTSRGSTVTVSWNATNPPSGAHIALWLYDVRLDTTTALIADGLAASSTYAWHLPNANSTCDPESIDVCGADLVPGRQYGIEADLYTDTSDPNNPNIVDYGFTPEPFTISS